MWKSYAKCEKVTLNVKNDRSGKCEKMSTLNVKSCRSGKCETNSTLNVKTVWSVAWPVRWSVWTIWSAWSVFSAFSGFGVSTFQKLKILRSVMILRENVKCWSKSGQRAFSWGFRCKKNRGGGHWIELNFIQHNRKYRFSVVTIWLTQLYTQTINNEVTHCTLLYN